jgi:predicted GIY-YIG superfamily endonuclease
MVVVSIVLYGSSAMMTGDGDHTRKGHQKWRRAWKIRLIEADNPGWFDRYESVSS